MYTHISEYGWVNHFLFGISDMPRTVAGEALIRQAEEAEQRAPELGAQ